MKLYRYNDNNYREHLYDVKNIILVEYDVIKLTPKGFKINHNGKEKFVLKGNNGKRFAYESKKSALESYIIRKSRQILHAKMSIEKANYFLSIAIDMEE